MVRKFEVKTNQDFTLLWIAFTARGNESSSQQRKQQTKADHLLEAKIGKELKRISTPIGELPADSLDMRGRKLKSIDEVIQLEQAPFARLLQFVENTQWQSILIDEAVDLMERLETAEKIN